MRSKYLIVLIIISSCGAENNPSRETKATSENHVVLTEEQSKLLNIQTDTLRMMPMETIVKFSAVFENSPDGRAVVSPRMGGYIKSIFVSEGSLVKQGEAIAELENLELIRMEEDFLSASAELEFLNKEVTRQRLLNQNKSVSDKTLQETELRLTQVTAKCKALITEFRVLGINPAEISTQTISGNFKLYSPIEGIITNVSGSVGAYLNATDVVAGISNKTDLLLVGRLYERDRDRVYVGGKLRYNLNTNPDQWYNAEVIRISGKLNDDKSLSVYCRPIDRPSSVSEGMSINAEFNIPSQTSIPLPDDAVVNFEQRNFLFLMDQPNEYIMTEIDILSKGANAIQISDTLLAKKIFVTTGAHSLLMALKNHSDE